MAKIRSAGNKDTEIRLATILRAYGISGWRRRQNLLGKPDFLFRSARLAVFVDGCFWHSCPKHGRIPASNQDYWIPKLKRNRQRDQIVSRKLRDAGWRVLRLWAHALHEPCSVVKKISSLLSPSRHGCKNGVFIMNNRKGHAKQRQRRGARIAGGKDAPRYLQRSNAATGALMKGPVTYKANGRPSASRPFSTIDLFCGAGGISEGFRRAGFACLYANDIDHWAVETFRANHPNTRVDNRAIEKVDAAVLRRELGLRMGELDVVVGGAPCQGFSINAPERALEDPRNSLFKHYVRFLEEFEPKMLLIENAPGMLSLGGGIIFDRIVTELHRRGYQVQARILFAAHYGVPQGRWRTIILGSRFSPSPAHPEPTHYAEAPANFKGGRTMTFRLLPLQRHALLPAITLREAIGDLPRLEMGQGGEIVAYDNAAESEYALRMRGNGTVTFNHFARILAPKNIERMKFVRPGGSWRDIPHELLPKGMQRARKSDHTKRYGRLRYDGLAGTVMTKCDPHWGAVFLPDQDRALTVREAARIQSFPDCYKFLGPRVSQYGQVGNAVPVLMAEAIGRQLAKALERELENPEKAGLVPA